MAGSGAFTLTLFGSNFVSGSVVRWNGSDRATTFFNATQLTASIAAADIAAVGTASVTVFSPAPGGGTSNSLPFVISADNPVPAIDTLTPNAAASGSAAFTLTVFGSNIVAGAVVRWNGADRPTTFFNNTQVTASISAADIAAPGTVSVTVANPPPGGGPSNALTFTISGSNPAPTASGLSPASAVAGSSAFILTVSGTNFLASSVVRWNGSDRPTTFVSATQLNASIAAADVAAAGTATVTVFTPAPGGGTSAGLTFNITSSNPVPSIASLSPSCAAAGGAAFTLSVIGSNFIPASVVRWNGGDRPATFASSTQLSAAIAAADIAASGTAQVSVFNPPPGGGSSA
ncbi:MAG: beta strand repeat-containing protein, partial [Gammaproteobacteria bacterium]